MIELKTKEDCCGCSACANICPKSCIMMKSDEEGFLYPTVNQILCVNCGMCEKVCPEINTKKDIQFKQKAYVVQCKDECIRRESTSGGAFTPIAEYVIAKGGVVFGAAFKDKVNYHVSHQYVETKEELCKFRGSKYVQSSISNTYSQAKKFLDSGRLVCFSGTPCQIEGLKFFLRREYENLITIDFMCRAVPSPLVFQKYLQVQKKKFGNDIENIRFRDKYYGYSYSTMSIYAKRGSGKKDYHRGIESDLWLRAFFSGISIRPSCINCSFRKSFHNSDFTIWDCFNVRKFSTDLDDNKGTSRMLIQTEKGINIFEEIKRAFSYKEIAVELVYGIEKERAYSETAKGNREDFYRNLNSTDAEEVFNKYFPYTLKVRFLQYARYISFKMGVYKVLKKVWDFIKNR